MEANFTINENSHQVQPRFRRDISSLAIDGSLVSASLHWQGEHEAMLTLNGASQQVFVAQDNYALFIHLNGRTWQVDARDAFIDSAEAGEASGRITAPMPGVVVECRVERGDTVAAGTTVMLIESMKLQTEIKAPVSGTVAAVELGAGDSFEKGSVLVDITTNDDGAAPTA